MPALSFPFRISPVTRGAQTVEDGSDEEISEAVAAHVMVQPGERPMRPGFGTESLPFGDGLSLGSLQLQLTEYGWEHVVVTDIVTGDPQDNRVVSHVTWERRGS